MSLSLVISSGQEGGEEDGEGGRGEDGGDGVPDAQDGVVLVIRPGQLLVPTLELDQQRPGTAEIKYQSSSKKMIAGISFSNAS